MSGLAGLFSDEPPAEVRRRLRDVPLRLSGRNHAPRLHAEPGFGVAVSSAGPPRDDASAFAEIATNDRYVLAVEGYVFDVADLRARVDVTTETSRADTLLRLFVREGVDALARLNGAYAVAVWDRATRTGCLAHCAFGRRELFLAACGGAVAFASEPIVLALLTGQQFTLNPRAVSESFSCGVTYGEDWPLEGVTRPWPGSLCIVRDGRWHRRLLDARPADPPATAASREAYLEALDAHLARSADRLAHVTPDRAVLMSGGIDSPLAAAYMRRATGAVSTLTIGVPFGTDEREPAARLAQVLRSTHTSLLYDVEHIDLIDGMRRFVRVMQEPAWISTGVALLDVQDRTADLPSGIVSGLGADIFFGLLGFDPLAASAGGSRSLFRYVIAPVDERCARGVVAVTGPHPDRLLEELDGLARTDGAAGFVNVRRLTETASLVRLAARIARHSGREALFSYLDRDIYRFANEVPVALRAGDKPLLRALWARVFPHGLMVEDKVPFVTHTLHWCYLVNRVDDVLDLLSDRRTRERGVYLPDVLVALVARYRDRSREIDPRWHTVVWQIAVFELFCRELIDTDLRRPSGFVAQSDEGIDP